MSKQVIEFNGEPVGVVVPDHDRLKFLAVKYHVWALDAQRFSSVEEAQAAIRGLFAGPPVRSNPAQAGLAA